MTRNRENEDNNGDKTFFKDLTVDMFKSYFRDETVKELAEDGALIPEKTDKFSGRSNALSSSILSRMLRVVHQFLPPSSPQGESKQ
ncbi:MAG: hypothetical protein AAF471_08410 [Myxococcota bacterium]